MWGPTAWKTWVWLLVVGLIGTMVADAVEGQVALASRRLWLLALYLVQAYLMAHMAETGFDGELGWSADVALPRGERMLWLPLRLFATSWAVGSVLVALLSFFPSHALASVALLSFAVYFPAAAAVATLHELGTTIADPLLALRTMAALGRRLGPLLAATLGSFTAAWVLGGAVAPLHPVGYGLSWGAWLLAGLVSAKAWGLSMREEHAALGLVLPPNPDPSAQSSNHPPATGG